MTPDDLLALLPPPHATTFFRPFKDEESDQRFVRSLRFRFLLREQAVRKSCHHNATGKC
jgi:hypothetical protein